MIGQSGINDGGNAAIDHAKVGVVDRSVFPRLGTEVAAFGRAAAAQEFGADRRIHPGIGRPIKSVAKDEAFAAAVADNREKEAGLPDFFSRGSGRIGEPDERDAEQAEVRVDERGGFVDLDARVLREKLPARMFRIADGDPGRGQDVEVGVVLLDVFRFEIERIVGDEDGGIRFPLDADESAYVGEGAAAGADVVMGFVGFDVLIFVVVDDVAAREGFVGLVVVLHVVGAEALISVMNVDGAIGGGDVALAGLRTD